MTYGRSIGLAALAALLVLGSACGGDDDGGDKAGGGDSTSGGKGGSSSSGGADKDASSSTGGGGSGSAEKDRGSSTDEGGTGSSEGGTGGDVVGLMDASVGDGGTIEVCGAEICAEPMCCADAFVSKCGIRVNARACLPPAPTTAMSDERCPSVAIMNGAFMIPSCCTEDGMCGIDAAAAGMGCISLEEVRRYSMMDGSMGFGIMWPEPKACN